MGKGNGLWWTFTFIAAGIGAGLALISNAGTMPNWSVVTLVVIGGLLLSVGVIRLGWIKRAPYPPMGAVVRGVVAFFVIWGGMVFLGWIAKYTRIPSVSIKGYSISSFVPGKEIFANVYFLNNTDEPIDSTVYQSGGIGINPENEQDQIEIVEELFTATHKLVSEGGGPEFTIGPKEPKFFTIRGPVLSPDHAQKLLSGVYGFFFTATIVAKNGSDPRNIDVCGWIRGNKPNVVLECLRRKSKS